MYVCMYVYVVQYSSIYKLLFVVFSFISGGGVPERFPGGKPLPRTQHLRRRIEPRRAARAMLTRGPVALYDATRPRR